MFLLSPFFKSCLKDPNRNLDGNKRAVVKDHIKDLEEAIDNSKELAIQIEDNIVQIKNILIYFEIALILEDNLDIFLLAVFL